MSQKTTAEKHEALVCNKTRLPFRLVQSQLSEDVVGELCSECGELLAEYVI